MSATVSVFLRRLKKDTLFFHSCMTWSQWFDTADMGQGDTVYNNKCDMHQHDILHDKLHNKHLYSDGLTQNSNEVHLKFVNGTTFILQNLFQIYE